MMVYRSQNESWTVSDLLQKSVLISEGNPARYRLLTTRSDLDESGNVRKCTFGQQKINMKNKVILLMGEAGTGKTTLINVIVNYILGVKSDDDVWFEITDEAANQTDTETVDQTQTQTTVITVYEVFTKDNPTSVTIIDTPGYGDTRGEEYDQKIAKKLLKLLKKETGVKEIDAVCLLVKATVNHLFDRQHYIFDAILSVFGKDIEENIVVFITHSDGGPPTNVIKAIKKAKIPCRKDNENNPVYFLFNNRQAEQRTMTGQIVYQFAWELTANSLKNFFTSLEEHNRNSLANTESVLTESIRLKACVSNLHDRIKVKELKRKELTQIQKAVGENQEKIQRNEDVSFKVTRYCKEKVSTQNASWWSNKANCCSVCQENCHEYNCWFAFVPSWCEVMKDDHCTVCTGKCHYSKHVREKKKYVIKSEQVEMTYTELIQQYERNDESAGDISVNPLSFNDVRKELEINKQQMEEKKSIENRLTEELREIEKEKTQLVEKACTTLIKLTEIALKPESAFIMESLDFLIPRAEEAGRLDWVQKLKELRETETIVSAALRISSRFK